MEVYILEAHYYETDKMGFCHHSNYIRWMEEARTDYLKKIGYSYARLESEGVASPVTAVNVRYKHSTTYGDTLRIETRMTEYNGVRMHFAYTMYKEDGRVACEAESEHCFLNAAGRPVRMTRENPALHTLLTELCAREQAEIAAGK